jgi:hypothetical protein
LPLVGDDGSGWLDDKSAVNPNDLGHETCRDLVFPYAYSCNTITVPLSYAEEPLLSLNNVRIQQSDHEELFLFIV